ncbi:hypothetical protein [Schaalia vaccimaxillae]|uniref:hypothetical protein n=1 Tax=Schaalia vaccimaxillae TaxID=183916 RepID=UPI0003B55DF4|nr:hypothetical protein [Schaalia vaccimaxillae]
MSAHSSSRRLLALVIVVAATLIAGISWAVLAADPAPDSSPSAEMSGAAQSGPNTTRATITPQSAGPSASLVGSPLETSQATERAQWVLSTVAESLVDPAEVGQHTDLSSVLSGFALGEYEALASQYADEGLRQEGNAVLEDPQILSDLSTEDSFVLQACVDSTKVKILNEAGKDVRASGALDRALTLFTFVNEDDTWKLEKQGFTDDPTC